MNDISQDERLKLWQEAYLAAMRLCSYNTDLKRPIVAAENCNKFCVEVANLFLEGIDSTCRAIRRGEK